MLSTRVATLLTLPLEDAIRNNDVPLLERLVDLLKDRSGDDYARERRLALVHLAGLQEWQQQQRQQAAATSDGPPTASTGGKGAVPDAALARTGWPPPVAAAAAARKPSAKAAAATAATTAVAEVAATAAVPKAVVAASAAAAKGFPVKGTHAGNNAGDEGGGKPLAPPPPPLTNPYLSLPPPGESDTLYHFPIPNRIAGWVVGHNGQRIKDYNRRFPGTAMVVRPGGKLPDAPQFIKIKGDPEVIATAVKFLQGALAKAPKPKPGQPGDGQLILAEGGAYFAPPVVACDGGGKGDSGGGSGCIDDNDGGGGCDGDGGGVGGRSVLAAAYAQVAAAAAPSTACAAGAKGARGASAAPQTGAPHGNGVAAPLRHQSPQNATLSMPQARDAARIDAVGNGSRIDCGTASRAGAGAAAAAAAPITGEYAELHAFLSGVGLQPFYDAFVEQGWDLETVVWHAEDPHLSELGLRVGHKVKLRSAIVEERRRRGKPTRIELHATSPPPQHLQLQQQQQQQQGQQQQVASEGHAVAAALAPAARDNAGGAIATAGGAAVAAAAAAATDSETECVVCLCERRNALIMPCRHLVICSGCADILVDGLCPFCRRPYADIIKNIIIA
ncbi:unnamed protein product [Phaeothamnion confervicola]